MAELAHVLSFPSDKANALSPKEYDSATKEYVKEIGKLSQSFWTKQHEKQSLLELLNPATHSIPYLLTLRAYTRPSTKHDALQQTVLDAASIFFSSFNARQIRYAGEAFRDVLDWFFGAHDDVTDLTPLAAAMLRLDPTAGTFTTFHLDYVRKCLTNGVPSQALPILDRDIYAFPQPVIKSIASETYPEVQDLSNSYIKKDAGFSSPVKPEQVLEYYLLGAQVYIGIRKWSRARLFLETIILSPTQQHVSSALQVEGYKKWLLVGLLAQGRSWSYPRTYDQSSMKNLQGLGKAYEALAKNFEQRDWRKYQAEVDTGAQMFEEDGNTAIVREVGNALQKYRIIDLQKTYAALPVSRVAQHLEVSPASTLQSLTDLIGNGELNASIDSAANGSTDAVLRFGSGPANTPNASQEKEDLQTQTSRIEELIVCIRDADRRLKLTKEYTDHLRRAKRAGQSSDGDLAEHMDLTWDAPIPGPIGGDGGGHSDEDIMEG